MFQKRQDGSVDFYREWDDYKRGLGNPTGEFWLGLEQIHRVTASRSNKLRVDLEDVEGNTVFAEYSSFTVAGETENYLLSLGDYSGKLTFVSVDTKLPPRPRGVLRKFLGGGVPLGL